MRGRTALALLLVVGNVLAMGTQAQADGMPFAEIEVDLDAGPTPVPLGSEHAMSFGIDVAVGNIVCSSAATFVVTLAVSDEPSAMTGITHSVEPSSMTFDVAAGFYGKTIQPPFTGHQDAVLSITVANSTVEKHEHSLNVTASYAGGVPTNCQGAMSIPKTEGSAMHAMRTGARSLVSTSASDTGAPAGGGGSKESPGLGLLPLALVAVAVVALRRRA